MAEGDIQRARAERVILWQRCVTSADVAQAVAWVDQVQARVRADGGRTLTSLGTTVVAAFDSVELVDVVELGRALAHGVTSQAEAIRVHIGIAVGDVEEVSEPGDGVTYRGSVLDRAQALCARARPGEVVLDEVALSTAAEHFLFAREVNAGTVRGRALDAEHPHKRACRKALHALGPSPIASSIQPVFEALLEQAGQPGAKRVVIHSPSAAPALALIERLVQAAPPSLCLHVSRKAGGLQPLGGLALAIRRAFPKDSALDALGLPELLRARLHALVRGDMLPRAQIVETLIELLRVHNTAGKRPFIVLDQLHEIDPATLGVVAESTLGASCDFMLLMTLPPGTNVPPAFVAKTELYAAAIPVLPISDRRYIAESVLALEADSEIALRVALLGGESELGVLEAARTLVSAGDLVQQGKSFVWRSGPRSGTSAVPVEALITERALGLPHDAYRTLEVLCVAPPDVSRDALTEVVARDGLGAAELQLGLSQLIDEGFVDDALSLGSADSAVRAALRNNMPPARAAELHRFVASMLRALAPGPSFGSAQLAYHLAEGGQEAEAALALIDAARCAAEASFHRVALRLLATAVELDGSPAVRKLASEVAGKVDSASSQVRPQVPAAISGDAAKPEGAAARTPSMAERAMQRARRALMDKDYDIIERCLDTAVAAGWGRGSAQRFLAIAQLAQGQAYDASVTLSRVSTADATPATRARHAIGWALVHLEGGDALLAARSALDALATSRRVGDGRGENAALQVLAGCYRKSGREADAARIEDRIHTPET